MTDDKRPREWFIKNSFQEDHANIHGPKTKGCKVIEKSAYDALAKENETLKQTLKHDVDKIEAGYASERDQLKAEVERLKDTPGGKRLYLTFNELAREREITAMFREALECIERAYATHGERMAHQDFAARALARERSMRDEKI